MHTPDPPDDWIDRLADPDQQSDAISELRGLLLRGLKRAFSSMDEAFAEDVTQDSLIKILDRLDQFEGRSKFTTWAMSIAVRVGTSLMRRKYFQDVSLEDITGGDTLRVEVAVDTDTPSADTTLQQASLTEKLSELIDGLTDRQRKAIRALLGGMPVEEIATRMNSNRNAIYKLVHDARLKLRRGFELAGYSADDLLGSQS